MGEDGFRPVMLRLSKRVNSAKGDAASQNKPELMAIRARAAIYKTRRIAINLLLLRY
jgi:hypothetical protein